MEIIKTCTDLSQSRKLAKILPIESADMVFTLTNGHNSPIVLIKDINELDICDIPCWSLTALLSVLPNYQLQTQDDGIGILCSCNGEFNIITADNPVDACYKMILKLHKLNVL